MQSDSIVEFEFLDEMSMDLHVHENPEILFVLEGELAVKLEKEEYLLGEEDFILINANRLHGYHAKGKLFAVRFQLSMAKIRNTLHKNSVLFWCSSVFDQQKSYGDVRELLQNILLCNVNKGAKDEFYEKGLHYQLMSLLCGEYLLDNRSLGENSDEKSDHMSLLMEYIRANYQNRISLQDAADELFLSPTYLSKYIRKRSGQGFVDLISAVRLSHAVEDLMYTEDSIVKIAMDNGFASVAAFNQVFKKAYSVTPSAYRKEKKVKIDRSDNMQKTSVYLHRYMEHGARPKIKNEETLYLTSEKSQYKRLKLQSLINIGQAEDLFKRSTQDKLIYCKNQMGIRYVRFWNIFTPQMHLDHVGKTGKFNYDRLDEILDFLVTQELRPYMELRQKPVRLLQTADKAVLEHSHEVKISYEEFPEIFNDFLGHLIRRYGHVEVSNWIFSFCLDSDASFVDENFSYGLVDEIRWNKYLDAFDEVANTLKSRLPDALIGGPQFSVQHVSVEDMHRFLTMWSERSHRPNFLSMTSFPYQIVQEDGSWHEQRRTNFNFVVEDINTLKRAMTGTDFEELPIHLTEWNITLSDRSFINDSTIRAAFMASTFAGIFDKVAFAGIWNALDAYSDYDDSTEYLFGGTGILTKTGIPKPAAFTLYFLNRLYSEFAAGREGALVTINEKNHYKLLVNYLVDMNTAYYLKEENQLPAMGIEQMIKTSERKVMHVHLDGLKDGCWQIRRYQLNRNTGSILHDWMDFDSGVELRMEELNYLKGVFPRVYIQQKQVENSTLEFDLELEPNEVVYLHITEFN